MHFESLPSLPAIVLSIIELARVPTAGTAELARLVGRDPALSARMLAAANSVLYGNRDLSSLHQAVNRIGMEGALVLALSFSLPIQVKPDANGMDLDRFWKRALISGQVVRELEQLLGRRFDAETIHLAAVLQDIGMLALNALDPDVYGVIFHSARSHRQLASFEEREYGTNHVLVGHWLCARWGLPDRYIQPILNSHLLPREIDPADINHRILAFSGLMADPWISSNREMAMTLAYQASQDYLHLNEQHFSHLLLRLQDHLQETFRLFEVPPPNHIDTFNLLQEAKQLLAKRNLRLMQKMLRQQQEIETLRRNTERIQEQLKKDPLTGIYNRLHIEQQLEQHFSSLSKTGGHLAVVFIDLDYFKALNDQYGHALGDATLKAFASRLEQELHEGCMAGRYGGEEFVVLMPNHSQVAALQFASSLQEQLATTPLLSHGREDIYISASMGIALQRFQQTPEPVTGPASDAIFEDARAMMNAADQAMYNAKRSGRNRILLFTSQGGQILANPDLANKGSKSSRENKENKD